MAMQDAQKWKDSRSRVSSKKVPSHTMRIAYVSEGEIVVANLVGGRSTSSVGDIATSR
jgi:hypothetical protein